MEQFCPRGRSWRGLLLFDLGRLRSCFQFWNCSSKLNKISSDVSRVPSSAAVARDAVARFLCLGLNCHLTNLALAFWPLGASPKVGTPGTRLMFEYGDCTNQVTFAAATATSRTASQMCWAATINQKSGVVSTSDSEDKFSHPVAIWGHASVARQSSVPAELLLSTWCRDRASCPIVSWTLPSSWSKFPFDCSVDAIQSINWLLLSLMRFVCCRLAGVRYHFFGD